MEYAMHILYTLSTFQTSTYSLTDQIEFMKKFTFLLMLSLGSFLLTNAQQVVQPKSGAAGTWRLLGTTHAAKTVDHDVINVAGPYDFFRKLKFKVTGTPLTIYKMFVTYDDGGQPEKIEVRYDVPKGGESRVIELAGGKRKLRTIQFWYETKYFQTNQADVTLFGMK